MKMQTSKRLAIWAGLFLASQYMQGQSNTFNIVHYNISGGFSIGLSAREKPNGYLVFGLQTQLDTLRQDVTISRFDIIGQFMGESFLSHPRYEILGQSDPIATVPGGNGFIGGWSSLSGGVPIDTARAVRFNEQGDTLWTKFLFRDTIAYVTKAVAKNNKFYFTGVKVSNFQASGGALVMRTDTLANIELQQPQLVITPNSMDVDGDGGMYVAGNRNNNGYVLKVDSTGNLIWSRFSPKQLGNWYGVKHMFNNKLLCMGSWRAEHQPLNDTTTMYLCMYNESGALQWAFEGFTDRGTQGATFFTDGYQDSDSTFIVCGPVQRTFWNRALIYRFTADGTPLWRRDYAHFANISALYPEIPWDIEPTSDGGMVLTGETWNQDTVPPYSNQNMWLLKLDSMGCLVPGCQYVGINEVAYGLGHALKVWPNPSDGRVNMALELPGGLPLEGDMMLQVFDMNGRVVLRKNLGTIEVQTIELDLSDQAAGLYSAHISDARRILTGAKIVIQ